MAMLTELTVDQILTEYPEFEVEDAFVAFEKKGETEYRLKESAERELFNRKTDSKLRKLVILNQGSEEELKLAQQIGSEIRKRVLDESFAQKIVGSAEKRFVRFLADLSYPAVTQMLSHAYAKNRKSLPSVRYDHLLTKTMEESGKSLTLEYLMAANGREFEKKKKENKKAANQ